MSSAFLSKNTLIQKPLTFRSIRGFGSTGNYDVPLIRVFMFFVLDLSLLLQRVFGFLPLFLFAFVLLAGVTHDFLLSVNRLLLYQDPKAFDDEGQKRRRICL